MTQRTDIPKVPACERCNAEKSKLEHYLMTVLPFGGRHRNALATFQEMVPKRLERNHALRERLTLGFTGNKIPLDPGQIETLFRFVTKGLLWHHFGVVLGANDHIAATCIRKGGEGFLDHIFTKMRARNSVDVNLGDGALVYQGVQAIDYVQFTAWRFLIYGGVQFEQQSLDSDGESSIIFAVTGPGGPLSRLWQTIFKEEFPAA